MTGGGEARGNNKPYESNLFKNRAWSMDYGMWLSSLALARELSPWPRKPLYDPMYSSIYHFKFLQGSLYFQDDGCNWTISG